MRGARALVPPKKGGGPVIAPAGVDETEVLYLADIPT